MQNYRIKAAIPITMILRVRGTMDWPEELESGLELVVVGGVDCPGVAKASGIDVQLAPARL